MPPMTRDDLPRAQARQGRAVRRWANITIGLYLFPVAVFVLLLVAFLAWWYMA